MDTSLILTVVAVGLICFVVGVLVGRRRGDGRMLMQQIPAQTPMQQIPASSLQPPPSVASHANAVVNAEGAIDERLRQYLREGKKIEAIKLFRERTLCSLKDAKDAVEDEESRMRAGVPVQTRSSFGDGAIAHEHINVQFGGELFEMLSAGRREEVLRLVRERSGLGEAEAEAVVARLESLMGRLGNLGQ